MPLRTRQLRKNRRCPTRETAQPILPGEKVPRRHFTPHAGGYLVYLLHLCLTLASSSPIPNPLLSHQKSQAAREKSISYVQIARSRVRVADRNPRHPDGRKTKFSAHMKGRFAIFRTKQTTRYDYVSPRQLHL